ncbi:LOW QUALITY PROTEIN: putative Zn-dependent protease, contains TPR repeats [Marinobacter adhaerens HP15]|uniref:Putative beta-barrel assembly-enhancing protease n=1 Tax=Marinobacter adhaerens (strain DSM 23420 / HP15) TaxID=225937 RepID=E4PQS5_MARAH|nr:LOW QUALITY PROTEIN: putative Zn-dependent protease, contains TPR repeats [Marinobacter adhaerens HP15]
MAITALLALLLFSMPSHAQENRLPSIGGSGGGLIAGQQESDIGQQVMVSIRRSAPRISDPLVYDYLSAITYRLVPSAPLQNRDLTLALIDSPAINAFAVPGGIVGVNGGLFLNAATEQQFASVLAHELAHLSQRHFARRMEQQETSAPLTLAGMIAGIVLSAVTQSDIGLPPLPGPRRWPPRTCSPTAAPMNRKPTGSGWTFWPAPGWTLAACRKCLKSMRQNRMQGNRLPEYLSTHPLTQSRVADTRNRAEQYPDENIRDGQEYHLMRSRLQVHYAPSPDVAVETFEAYLDRPDAQRNDAIRYGLSVAYLEDRQYEKAVDILNDLLATNPGRITFQVTLAEVRLAQDRVDEARSILKDALARNPGNYPITHTLALTEIADGNGAAAAEHLKQLTRQLPGQEHLWLKLAEAEGMARNIVGVHRARAEYDVLMGDLESAQRQLRQAQEKLPAGAPQRQIVTERLAEITSRLHARANS